MPEYLIDYAPGDNLSGVVPDDAPITQLDPGIPDGARTFDGGDPQQLLDGIPQPGGNAAGMVNARTQTGGYYRTTASLAGPQDERTEVTGTIEDR